MNSCTETSVTETGMNENVITGGVQYEEQQYGAHSTTAS